MTTHQSRRYLALVVATSLLAGCATNNPRYSPVEDIEQQLAEQYPALTIEQGALARTAEENSAHQSDSSSAIEGQYTLQKAIHILLTRSPQVRLQLAELGVADAQRLQAELIANPHISIGALRPEGGGRWQLDTSLSQPLLGVLTRPLRKQYAQEKLLNAQLELQTALQELIAETTHLYFSAVAALQHCDVQFNMLEATKAKQQLALSLFDAGNMSENNFLFYDNELRRSQQQLEKRQAQAYEKQLALLNFIGLESRQPIDLPARLPALPQEAFEHSDLFAKAKKNRADVKIAQRQLELVNQRKQLIARDYGWRDISLGINAEREFDGATNLGPEVEFALPIFNRGQAKLAALEAERARLSAKRDQLELAADTQIAQALNTMSSARAQLTILQAAMATSEKRVALSNREVNFMLTSPLELLTIKRQQIQLAHELTVGLKDYWQARAQLELAVGGALSTTMDNEHSSHSLQTPAADHHTHSADQTQRHDHQHHNEEHNHD